jgi:hypothetical protein
MTDVFTGKDLFYSSGKNNGPKLLAIPLDESRLKFIIADLQARNLGNLDLTAGEDFSATGLIGPYIIAEIEKVLGIKNSVVTFPPRETKSPQA